MFILILRLAARRMRHCGAYPPLKGRAVHVREPAHFSRGPGSGAWAALIVQENFLKAGEGVGEPNRPDAPVMSAGESI